MSVEDYTKWPVRVNKLYGFITMPDKLWRLFIMTGEGDKNDIISQINQGSWELCILAKHYA